MSAVFKKEFFQLFHSMIGYVCLAVFAAITGYYFFTLNLLAASGDVRGYFSSVANVIMLILPMLTMRSFSEEKKMRTDQPLIASPVSSFAIVMGKALATACFFIVCLLPCAAHMLWLFRFCNADLRLIACCAIGLLLTASAFLSIGLYLSAVTENQVIACVVTYGVLLAFWLVGYASTYVSIDWLRQFLYAASLLNRYSRFAMGILTFSDVIYALSLCCLFLFLCVNAFEKRRKS